MAGHLPIPIDREITLILAEVKSINIEEQKPFERIRVPNGFYQLLTDEYKMDEEHGGKDHLIFAFTPSHLRFIYEFHLDEKGFINQVYKVE